MPVLLRPKQKVLLRFNLRIATIVKVLTDEKYLVNYYDENNKFKWAIITFDDLMDKREYDIMRDRNNKFNQILRD